MRLSYRRQRKGIILIIIISILTMFMLIGVTYVVVSGHFEQTAVINLRANQVEVTAEKQLDTALFQVLRGTDSPGSALRGHNLMEDKYGHKAIYGVIVEATHVHSEEHNRDLYPARDTILELKVYLHDIYRMGDRGRDGSVTIPGSFIPYTPYAPERHIPLTLGMQDERTIYPENEDPPVVLTRQGVSLLGLGALNGRVFTFLESTAKHHSSRILKSNWNFQNPDIEDFDPRYNFIIRVPFPPISVSTPASNFEGKTFLINGRDFSGTGGGLKANTVANTATQLDHGSLLPIRATDGASDFAAYRQGGLNEGYDVPDYQNMLLAGLLTNPNPAGDRELQHIIPSLHRPALFNYWIHHRHDFIDLESMTLEQQAEMRNPVIYNRALASTLRRIIARPLPWDHPDFSGGNEALSVTNVLLDVQQTAMNLGLPMPGRSNVDDDGNGHRDYFDHNQNGQFDPGIDEIDYNELFFVQGNNIWDNPSALRPAKNEFPWDVDNDADGKADSIWVDLGAPIQTNGTGRLYKPLFAILCTDLDGRINVNTHGNASHYLALESSNAPVPLAGGQTTQGFPRGLGYGPSEINLFGSLLRPNAEGVQDYKEILASRYNVSSDSIWGAGFDTPPRRDPNRTHHPIVGLLPPWNGYSGNYLAAGSWNSYFQSTTDIWGELARGINTAGNPVSEAVQQPVRGALRDMITDNPYEAIVSTTLPFTDPDHPFESRDLERVLRYNDSDQPTYIHVGSDGKWGIANQDDDGNGITDDISEALSEGSDDYIAKATNGSRLLELTDTFENPANQRAVTTESFDPPVPSVQIPKHLRGHVNLDDGGHVVQLLRARILEELGGERLALRELGGGSPVKLEYELNKLMAPINSMTGTRNPLIDIKLLDGLKMDVNRPFGNGQDDNGDGVVDNFSEIFMNAGPNLFNFTVDNPSDLNDDGRIDYKDMRDAEPWVANYIPEVVPFDRDNDGQFGSNVEEWDANLARYHFARQLYVLALLFNDRNEHGDTAYPPQNNNDEFNIEAEREFDDLSWRYHWAQWAINVVDFRDPDSAMTPFEFDLNPFDGWDVDGQINSEMTPSGDDNHRDRALVWGTERPELLISESVVFHDRRSEDIKEVGGANDGISDQRLMPQSGAFFELYNPWFNPSSDANAPASGALPPAEFYANGELRLDKASYHANKDGWFSPVFRMLVIKGPNEADHMKDPDAHEADRRPANNDIQRAIYFTQSRHRANNNDPSNQVDIPTGPGHGKEQFFTTIEPGGLQGGSYAVIGSSGQEIGSHGRTADGHDYYDTWIGRHKRAVGGQGNTAEGRDALRYDETRRIRLIPDPDVQVQARLLNNGFIDQFHGDNYKYIRNQNGEVELVGPRTNQKVIALPINRALRGGVAEERSLTLTEPVNGYGVNSLPGMDGGEREINPPLDIPLDTHLRNDVLKTGLNVNGTVLNYAVVHLQRLADPMRPYDEATNPYLTIDSSSIDVVAFNSVGNENLPGDRIVDGDYQNHINDGDAAEPKIVSSRQRGNRVEGNLIWKFEPRSALVAEMAEGAVVDPAVRRNLNDRLAAQQGFEYDLKVTLGFLNRGYGQPQPNGTPQPNSPFPWLQWNNRPFVTNTEMMQVPYSRSSRLLHDFDVMENPDPYNDDRDLISGQFPHLINFFNASNSADLFEYTETPTQYDAAYDYMPAFERNINGNETIFRHGTEELYPPFNKVSFFRDPGKININTVYDPAVFAGVMNGHGSGSGATGLLIYPDWVNSRRDYIPNVFGLYHNDVPTQFQNPLRPIASTDMVPLRSMIYERDETTYPSLLRGNDNNEEANDNNHTLLGNYYADHARNTQRNPTFKYQALQRMSNLVTSRSNVYAVWVTVAYFEVRSVPNSVLYPDGYILGQELGLDTGQAERHRMFSVIDRSIPTAYDGGKNHNVEKTILHRTLIE